MLIGVLIGIGVIVVLIVMYFVGDEALTKERNEKAREEKALRELEEKQRLDALRNSPTMTILENIRSIPLSSWRSAGQRTGRDSEGTYTILIFRTTTPKGLSIELHRCWYTSSYNYGPWGHVFVDGTEIPRIDPYVPILDSISSNVQDGYNKPDSDRMKDLLNKM